MTEPIDRRRFLGTASAASLMLLPAHAEIKGANEKLIVGVMGTGGRGTGLAQLFEQQPQCEVAYVCDVARERMDQAAQMVAKVKNRTPRTVKDFRHILDDKDVNILVIATCNHWHAPAAILACAAGKHVYVEKPCSHNPREGELLVEAGRKYKRQVQMGNQRRSWPKIIEAIEEVRAGAIGRAYYARSWYTNVRPSIGKGSLAPVPDGLDFRLWQGPAPRRPFHTNYLHYNWHWFWHWGNGELGNNGVHMLDVCRWGLDVDFPLHVSSSGGRYRFDDDQETPDTHLVSFNFAGNKTITWEGLSCSQLPKGQAADVLFVGEKGTLTIDGASYTICDPGGKEIRKVSGTGRDADHVQNLFDGIRSGQALHSGIEEAAKSTLLCHLGNIAHRTGRALHCDGKTGKFDDREGMALWSREYEKGWEPKV
jgi:predicted dehydrogenase